MVSYFYNNMVKFDVINKLCYVHSTAVFKLIKLKFRLHFNNLQVMLNSMVFAKTISKSRIRLYLSKNLFVNHIGNNIINSGAFHNLFLLLIINNLPIINKLFTFIYFYYCRTTVLQLKHLQKAFIIFKNLKVSSININRDELYFINNNIQVN
jgi:hypothetical protein